MWSLSDWNRSRIQNYLVRNRTVNHFAQQAKWLSCVLSTYLYDVFDCMFWSCHVRVSEWIHTLYICLNFEDLLPGSSHEIWSLSDCNWTQILNDLVRNKTFKHLAKLSKWLSCVFWVFIYTLPLSVCSFRITYAFQSDSTPYSCLNVN